MSPKSYLSAQQERIVSNVHWHGEDWAQKSQVAIIACQDHSDLTEAISDQIITRTWPSEALLAQGNPKESSTAGHPVPSNMKDQPSQSSPQYSPLLNTAFQPKPTPPSKISRNCNTRTDSGSARLLVHSIKKTSTTFPAGNLDISISAVRVPWKGNGDMAPPGLERSEM